MSTTDELRQRLAETRNILAQLEASAIDAVIGGKSERDLAALETRKAQARERIAVLGSAIKHLDQQTQIDAQKRMLAQTMEFIAPLVAPMEQATAQLALPPYDKPVHPLEPDVVKPKQTYRWFGNPKEGGDRWNER